MDFLLYDKIYKILSTGPKSAEEVIVELKKENYMPQCMDPEAYIYDFMAFRFRKSSGKFLQEERVFRHHQIDAPKVLVCDEKGGALFFYILDRSALYSTALSILEGRLKLGYFYNPTTQPQPPDFNKYQAETFPESLKAEAMRKLADYDRRISEWEKYHNQWIKINNAVQMHDGLLAYTILLARCDHEYEGIKLNEFCAKYC